LDRHTSRRVSALKVPAEQAAFAAAFERLAHRQLVALVVGQAVKDRLFAATLLRQAGPLDPADDEHLHRFRQVLRDTAEVTSGKRWGIPDVETAGHRLVAEVEILRVHPATIDVLDLVEEAIVAWDELSATSSTPTTSGRRARGVRHAAHPSSRRPV
jgi:hypothetical protein